MKEADFRKYREKHGMLERPRATRTALPELGGCPACGHLVLAIEDYEFCPCEDCHSGGLVIRQRAYSLAS